jgi:hypothetical protein
MKKLFISIGLIMLGLTSCKKEEIKPAETYWATIHLPASFINRMYNEGNDSIYVEVTQNKIISMATSNNPCYSQGFGYHKTVKENTPEIYTIRTERLFVESDLLIYKKEGNVTIIK